MIRVIIDLTRLEHLPHKRVWFPIDPFAVDTVKKFKISLCEQFNLKRKHVQLYVKDALIRDEDTILLLRDDDVISVLLKAEKRTLKSKEDCPNTEVSLQTSDQLMCLQPTNSRMKKQICFSNEKVVTQENKRKKISVVDNSTDDSKFGESQICIKEIGRKKKKDYFSASLEHIPSSDLLLSTCSNSVGKSEGVKNCFAEGQDDLQKKKFKKKKEQEKDLLAPVLSQNPLLELSNNEHVSVEDKSKEESHSVLDKSDTISNTLPNAVTEASIESSQNSLFRRRRKRRRRKPKKSTVAINPHEECVVPVAPIMSGLTTTSVVSEFKVKENLSKHVKFLESSSDEDISEKLKDFCDGNSGGNNCEQNTSTPKFSHLPYEGNYENSLNVSTSMAISSPVSYNGFSRPNKQSTKVQDLPIPDTACDNNTQIKLEPVTRNSNTYTPLKTVPSVDAHIAFKMYELSETYCPTVSDYKEGVIKRIDPDDEKIEIELFKEEIKPVRDGKFELVYPNDPPDDPETVKTISLHWSEMIDPQLIGGKQS